MARIRGVRSAMPMFLARKICPDAAFVLPRMEAYSSVSQRIRKLILQFTPLVEPLALDEAFLDLSGTERLHGKSPATVLAALAQQISDQFGISASVGLSHNKFLAKLASEQDKPRGYCIIGKEETLRFLSPLPVKSLWGVGGCSQAQLARYNIFSIGDLQQFGQLELMQMFGSNGIRLWELSNGQDNRRIVAGGQAKSLSNELTFEKDIENPAILDKHVWCLADQVSARAKAKSLQGSVVVLKVKRSDHSLVTRQRRLQLPTQSAELIYDHARSLLNKVLHRAPFRLIGLGLCDLDRNHGSINTEAVLDSNRSARILTERATDELRRKYGPEVIAKGRSLSSTNS